MRCPHMERMQACAANLCITFINTILTLLSDENHFFCKIPVYCEDMHTPLSVNALRATARPSRLCLRPEKPVPLSRKASSVMPYGLYRRTEKPFRQYDRHRPATRKSPFGTTECPVRLSRSVFMTVENGWNRRPTSWKPCRNREKAALLLTHEKHRMERVLLRNVNSRTV